MKFSPWLYLAGFSFTSAAIVVEQVEKHRIRREEAEKWQTADKWATAESSSSQSAQQRSESS
jgi:hypothetical protein